MDEFNIIDKYFRPLAKKSYNSCNLLDDTAILKDCNVVSKDMFCEKIHFSIEEGAYNIANRLIKSNISDIAASGAKPLHYMLGFSKNSQINDNFLFNFTKALKNNNEEFGISLIGGDTIKSNNNLIFSITIFGKVENRKNILSRSNAKAEELIYVSGNIGDAYLGRKIFGKSYIANLDNKKYLTNRYFNPTPRVDLGQKLIQNNISKSAIDISDGLLSDLRHLCQASNLGANIFRDKINFSDQALKTVQENKIDINTLISSGDDFELLFTANKNRQSEIDKLSKELQIPLTNIGYLVSNNQSNIKIFDKNEEIRITKFGYEH